MTKRRSNDPTTSTRGVASLAAGTSLDAPDVGVLLVATEKRCRFDVWEGYHSHLCDRPVKVVITTKEGTERGVCGIHRRMHERHPLNEGWFK
jgi:hypothetical protein